MLDGIVKELCETTVNEKNSMSITSDLPCVSHFIYKAKERGLTVSHDDTRVYASGEKSEVNQLFAYMQMYIALFL